MDVMLTEGPDHLYSKFNKIDLDAPSPVLEPGQSAVIVTSHRKTIDYIHGTWRWVAGWEIRMDMKVICAWCDKFIGFKKDECSNEDTPRISHGICPACEKKELARLKEKRK